MRRKLTDAARGASANLARSRDKITGVSSFPNLAEQPIFSRPEDLGHRSGRARRGRRGAAIAPPAAKGKRFAAMVEAAASGATLKGLERACDTPDGALRFHPADRRARRRAVRAASRRLRPGDEPRRAPARRCSSPISAPLAEYNARASWAQNFFAAGGIEALDEGGFTDLMSWCANFQRSPAPIACICASDKTLAEMPGVAAALKNAGAVAVYLAAEPAALALLAEADKRAHRPHHLRWLQHAEDADRIASHDAGEGAGQAPSRRNSTTTTMGPRQPARAIMDRTRMSRLPNFAQMEWALPATGAARRRPARALDDARGHRAAAGL